MLTGELSVFGVFISMGLTYCVLVDPSFLDTTASACLLVCAQPFVRGDEKIVLRSCAVLMFVSQRYGDLGPHCYRNRSDDKGHQGGEVLACALMKWSRFFKRLGEGPVDPKVQDMHTAGEA